MRDIIWHGRKIFMGLLILFMIPVAVIVWLLWETKGKTANSDSYFHAVIYGRRKNGEKLPHH